MGAARMKDQADFDLERFIDMFDQAMTSNDERVVNALRSLMMMVILTNPEDGQKRAAGPLRRMVEDQNNIIRRLDTINEEIRRLQDYRYHESKYEQRRYSTSDQFFKWPAQYPTWDLKKVEEEDFIKAAKYINGGYHAQTAVAAQTPQIQPQPLTKGNKNG